MTTEEKALALLNEVQGSTFTSLTRDSSAIEALCRAIEQHEAFEQKVSNIVHHYVYADGGPDDWEKLITLIIPAPKPDPLVKVLEKMGWYNAPNAPKDAENFRAALDALGFEIREKNDD